MTEKKIIWCIWVITAMLLATVIGLVAIAPHPCWGQPLTPPPTVTEPLGDRIWNAERAWQQAHPGQVPTKAERKAIVREAAGKRVPPGLAKKVQP